MTQESLDGKVGELVGEMRQFGKRLDGLDQRFGEMHSANASDHAAVISRLDTLAAEVRTGLEQKADRAIVDAHARQIDRLESLSDRAAGMAQLVRWGQGIAVVVIALLSYLAGSGHLG